MHVADFRLMEAMASGALIFVDHMYTPRPHPLIDNKHIVYYGTSMCVYLCVYVCIYACIYVCMCKYICICNTCVYINPSSIRLNIDI